VAVLYFGFQVNIAFVLPILAWVMVFLKQVRSWWSAAVWQQTGFCGCCIFVQVSEYFPDHHRTFDTGDDLHLTTTPTHGPPFFSVTYDSG
jgi:hypothetical protein